MAKPTRLKNGKWRIRWTDENGTRKSSVFSSKKDAQLKLLENKTLAEQIKRGFKSREVHSISFSELCEHWLTVRTAQKRSPKDDRSIINRHLRPFFANYPIRQINNSIADQYKLEKKHLSPKTINNHLTLLISLLNLAFDLGQIEKAPKIKKPSVSINQTDFRFLKNKEEIENFLCAAKKVGDFHYELYLAAVFTGMRKGELAGLQWSDINFDKRIITVQRSFHKPTKSSNIKYVPILDVFLEVLIRRRRSATSKYVFAELDGSMLPDWHRVFKKDFHQTLDIAGFPKITKTNGKLERYITFHSLRHTFASHWMMEKGDLFKLQKVLGHQGIAMTLRYSHLSPDAFVKDFSRLNCIAGALEPDFKSDNIIKLKERKK